MCGPPLRLGTVCGVPPAVLFRPPVAAPLWLKRPIGESWRGPLLWVIGLTQANALFFTKKLVRGRERQPRRCFPLAGRLIALPPKLPLFCA